MANPNALTILDASPVVLAEWHKSLSLRAKTGELAATTATTYQAGARHFLTWCAEQGEDLAAADPDTVRAWLAEVLETCKPNTAAVWLAGLRAFYSWAMAKGLTVDPTAGVKGPERKGTTRAHLRDALTDDEVRRVLAAPDPTTQGGARDAAILALMAYTGVRTVEIHRANLADLRTNGGRLVLYVQGKGRSEKDEFVVIPPKAEDALHEWLAISGRRPGPLFWSLSPATRGERLSLRALRELVKGYYQAAGVAGDRKTTHSLRHSAISKAAQVLPLQKVQSMARHADPKTTAIYYHERDRLSNPAEDSISYE